MRWQDQCRKGTKLSERSGALADDPFSGRHPTSHERLTGLPWDASYHDGPAPWDIGQPQPAIVGVASEGGFAGAVLDAGCGTGENALHVASLGLSVLGVDVAETALAIAREKADDLGIEVEFAAADVFQLERLGRRFETVLDCGLFHTFDGDERPGYVASLASVTEHDGTLYALCFSDDGPDTGLHPISQAELRERRSTPAMDGMSPPSNRTGFRRDTTTTAHRHGSRQSNGSRLRDWSALCRSPGRACGVERPEHPPARQLPRLRVGGDPTGRRILRRTDPLTDRLDRGQPLRAGPVQPATHNPPAWNPAAPVPLRATYAA